uniref:Uncharacterized protein n=1 Tax=Arundo donax TaxID=35708 RepID=A0A0A9FD32_ARUDO
MCCSITPRISPSKPASMPSVPTMKFLVEDGAI